MKGIVTISVVLPSLFIISINYGSATCSVLTFPLKLSSLIITLIVDSSATLIVSIGYLDNASAFEFSSPFLYLMSNSYSANRRANRTGRAGDEAFINHCNERWSVKIV
jgi:hypothetical protein